MGGFFIQPKSFNRDNAQGLNNVRAINVDPNQEKEFIPTSGFNPDENIGVARHNRDPQRREAAPNSPLPTGGRPAGVSGGVRGWRGSVSQNVSSGFGKGSRSGGRGVRRG